MIKKIMIFACLGGIFSAEAMEEEPVTDQPLTRKITGKSKTTRKPKTVSTKKLKEQEEQEKKEKLEREKQQEEKKKKEQEEQLKNFISFDYNLSFKEIEKKIDEKNEKGFVLPENKRLLRAYLYTKFKPNDTFNNLKPMKIKGIETIITNPNLSSTTDSKILETLNNAKIINLYFNAIERFTLDNQSPQTVLMNFVALSDDLTNLQEKIVSQKDNFITFLLRQIAYDYENSDYSKLLETLKEKKLEGFINFIIQTSLSYYIEQEVSKNNLPDEEKQLEIIDYNKGPTSLLKEIKKLDHSSEAYKNSIKTLNDSNLKKFAEFIEQIEVPKEENSSEEKTKLEELPKEEEEEKKELEGIEKEQKAKKELEKKLEEERIKKEEQENELKNIEEKLNKEKTELQKIQKTEKIINTEPKNISDFFDFSSNNKNNLEDIINKQYGKPNYFSIVADPNGKSLMAYLYNTYQDKFKTNNQPLLYYDPSTILSTDQNELKQKFLREFNNIKKVVDDVFKETKDHSNQKKLINFFFNSIKKSYDTNKKEINNLNYLSINNVLKNKYGVDLSLLNKKTDIEANIIKLEEQKKLLDVNIKKEEDELQEIEADLLKILEEEKKKELEEQKKIEEEKRLEEEKQEKKRLEEEERIKKEQEALNEEVKKRETSEAKAERFKKEKEERKKNKEQKVKENVEQFSKALFSISITNR